MKGVNYRPHGRYTQSMVVNGQVTNKSWTVSSLSQMQHFLEPSISVWPDYILWEPHLYQSTTWKSWYWTALCSSKCIACENLNGVDEVIIHGTFYQRFDLPNLLLAKTRASLMRSAYTDLTKKTPELCNSSESHHVPEIDWSTLSYELNVTKPSTYTQWAAFKTRYSKGSLVLRKL